MAKGNSGCAPGVVLLVALQAACPGWTPWGSPCGPGVPEGCVEGACQRDYAFPSPPLMPSVEHFFVPRDCVEDSLDEEGRPIRYRCGGQTITIEYDELDRPVTVSHAQDGGGLDDVMTFQYDDTGNILEVEISAALNGQQLTFRRSSYQYQEGALVGTEEYWEYDEDVDPEIRGLEAGNYTDARYTDDGVERSLTRMTWDAAGQPVETAHMAGLSALVLWRETYQFDDDGRLLSILHYFDTGDDSATFADGCTELSPGVAECLEVLEYDDDGDLVAYTSYGGRTAISENCCAPCGE